MPILGLFLMFALIGLCAWLLITYVPMPEAIKTLIVVAAVICCVLMLMQALGYGPTIPKIR